MVGQTYQSIKIQYDVSYLCNVKMFLKTTICITQAVIFLKAEYLSRQICGFVWLVNTCNVDNSRPKPDGSEFRPGAIKTFSKQVWPESHVSDHGRSKKICSDQFSGRVVHFLNLIRHRQARPEKISLRAQAIRLNFVQAREPGLNCTDCCVHVFNVN